MGTKKFLITLFVLSLISFLISFKLFWGLGIFVDEYSLSPDIVNGGDFWLSIYRQYLGEHFLDGAGCHKAII